MQQSLQKLLHRQIPSYSDTIYYAFIDCTPNMQKWINKLDIFVTILSQSSPQPFFITIIINTPFFWSILLSQSKSLLKINNILLSLIEIMNYLMQLLCIPQGRMFQRQIQWLKFTVLCDITVNLQEIRDNNIWFINLWAIFESQDAHIEIFEFIKGIEIPSINKLSSILFDCLPLTILLILH